MNPVPPLWHMHLHSVNKINKYYYMTGKEVDSISPEEGRGHTCMV